VHDDDEETTVMEWRVLWVRNGNGEFEFELGFGVGGRGIEWETRREGQRVEGMVNGWMGGRWMRMEDVEVLMAWGHTCDVTGPGGVVSLNS
jgi:hypothetical protein